MVITQSPWQQMNMLEEDEEEEEEKKRKITFQTNMENVMRSRKDLKENS